MGVPLAPDTFNPAVWWASSSALAVAIAIGSVPLFASPNDHRSRLAVAGDPQYSLLRAPRPVLVGPAGVERRWLAS